MRKRNNSVKQRRRLQPITYIGERNGRLGREFHGHDVDGDQYAAAADAAARRQYQAHDGKRYANEIRAVDGVQVLVGAIARWRRQPRLAAMVVVRRRLSRGGTRVAMLKYKGCEVAIPVALFSACGAVIMLLPVRHSSSVCVHHLVYESLRSKQ
jgi:hypothetical protein